jgi:hypothetical protein
MELEPELYGKPRKTLGQEAKCLHIQAFDSAEDRFDDARNPVGRSGMRIGRFDGQTGDGSAMKTKKTNMEMEMEMEMERLLSSCWKY